MGSFFQGGRCSPQAEETHMAVNSLQSKAAQQFSCHFPAAQWFSCSFPAAPLASLGGTTGLATSLHLLLGQPALLWSTRHLLPAPCIRPADFSTVLKGGGGLCGDSVLGPGHAWLPSVVVLAAV